MNKAEAKAVVTIPMKGRYFLHKNGSIIPIEYRVMHDIPYHKIR